MMTIPPLPTDGQLIFIGKNYITLNAGFSKTTINLFNSLSDAVEICIIPPLELPSAQRYRVTLGEFRAWLAERDKAAQELGAAALETQRSLTAADAMNSPGVKADAEVTLPPVLAAAPVPPLDGASVERAYTEATKPGAPLPSADADADFDPGF